MISNNFIITTDSSCDIPDYLCKKNRLKVLPMFYCINNEIFNAINNKDFNFLTDKTSAITTIAPNIEECNSFLLDALKVSKNIIHISFSSALSSTYQNMCICASELNKKNNNIKIIDSLSASLGQGLIVLKSLEYAKNHNFYDVINFIEEIKNKTIHLFSVDDLLYLQKGGRINKKTAILGNIIGIKPLLDMNDKGELQLFDKVRCRKKALHYIINQLFENIKKYPLENRKISISHYLCAHDANFICNKIIQDYPDIEIIKGIINPAIASHSGPGTIAVFYYSDKRTETAN